MKKKYVLFFLLLFLFIPSVNAATEVVSCGETNDIPAFIVDLVRFAFKLIKYLVPVLIVVLGSFDFIKALTSSDADMLKKAWKSFSKKLVAGVLVFLLIALFQTIIKLVTTDATTNCMTCFFVNKDGCSYYYKEESAETGPNKVKDNQTDFDDPSTGNDKSIEELIGAEIPSNLSAKRKKILEVAASAIGKIPYYYGGRANNAGFDGNDFGSTVTADAGGRTKKGLDCSHFVDWVYWTAIGDNLGNMATAGLVNKGTPISESELQIGDLGFLVNSTDQNAKNHVGIYVGNGKYIHETTKYNVEINNVTISEYSSFTYFIRIIED